MEYPTIFPNLKTILVRIPKTASTSINRHLYTCDCQQRDFGKKPRPPRVCASSMKTYKHSRITETRAVCPTDLYEASYKVAFVRNPWDWILSYYWHYGDTFMRENTFRNFLSGIPEMLLKHRCDRLPWHNIMPQMPQYEYIINENGEIEVDFIGKYENLHEDWRRLCGEIGINKNKWEQRGSEVTLSDTLTLPHLNANLTPRKHYRNYYTDIEIDMVYNLYKKDIEMFDYEF